MTLPTTGTLSFSSLRTEFAKSGAVNFSAYHRNGGIVGAGAPNVPLSGTMSLSQFHGAANQFVLVVSSNQANLDLRAMAIAAGWNSATPLAATINVGVIIMSNTVATPALFIAGSFPGGVSLINNGYIVGKGGIGGANQWFSYAQSSGTDTWSAGPGQPGGAAFSTSVAVTVTNNGTMAGGGGGGGSSLSGDNGYWELSGAPGGGGAGIIAGAGGLHGPNTFATRFTNYGGDGIAGTATTGGLGNNSGWYSIGGKGGDLGQPGAPGTGAPLVSRIGGPGANYAGGAAGSAVIGNGLVTWNAVGTRLGTIS
jgi:hypothetical protein